MTVFNHAKYRFSILFMLNNVVYKKNKIVICLGLIIFLMSFNVKANDRFTSAGDKLQIAIPIASLIIAVAKEDYVGASQTVEGAFWTATETHLLKHLIAAERPNKSNFDSFPSGHTSAAFQGAAFLQMRYGWAYGAPAYALASFVGYTRVRGKYHSWRDVGAGAALAISTQYVITKMNKSLTESFIVPYFDDNAYGVEFSTSF